MSPINPKLSQAIFDNDRRNNYRSSTRANCYVGINITSTGVGIKLK